MANSILFSNIPAKNTEKTNEKIIYHLSLDSSFSFICPDVKKREYFLSVISEMSSDEKTIIYRQDIIRDFEANPALLRQLTDLSSRFEELKATYKSIKKDSRHFNAGKKESVTSAKNILQTQALCLKRALLFVKAYGELLSECKLCSTGLTKLYSASNKICENEDYSKLITLCSKYENLSLNKYLDFKFSLNTQGNIEEYSLIDHRYIRITDPQLKKGLSLFKKSEGESYPCSRVDSIEISSYDELASSAITGISGLFESISEQIFAEFGALYRELAFYEVALKYVNTLSEKQIALCYPSVGEDSKVKIDQLYDLYLLVTKPQPDSVVPNDFEISGGSGGLLVLGDNGSGKTVFLRSVGTAQILFQAGLPIPCMNAQMLPFSKIVTQFSEAEKEFCEGNDAGRFEQEVRVLAQMADTLTKDSLVLLNETFQSTSYAEGAEGLYHFLNHLAALNIRWVLVSHLRQLEDMFSGANATIMHTTDGYKIEKAESH